MVQASTDGAQASDDSSSSDSSGSGDSSSSSSDPPSWFTYTGPSLGASVSLGASKSITIVGFQAVTNIVHQQAISWGTLSATVNGPTQVALAINGPRKTIKMDLGTTYTLAPGGYIHRYLAKNQVQGVEVQANGGQDSTDSANTSAQVVQVQSNGTENNTGPNLNANVNHNQG